MGLDWNNADGQTPLEEEEKEGLLIPSIATRGELDEFEHQNIERAIQWTLTRSFPAQIIFTADFVQLLHRKMFADVWKWAGEFRNTNKNIGKDKLTIPTELRYLLDDAQFWVNNAAYTPDEIAIRFKHRLVNIHCFPNGNGRHSRLMADIIIEKIFKLPVFSWGGRNTGILTDIRATYLTAIKLADRGDYHSLLAFARS